MSYPEAQDALIKAFRDLAIAKQTFIGTGGIVEFQVHRNELIMDIADGSRLSFPFVADVKEAQN